MRVSVKLCVLVACGGWTGWQVIATISGRRGCSPRIRFCKYFGESNPLFKNPEILAARRGDSAKFNQVNDKKGEVVLMDVF